jgi:hypothetical protein
MQLREKKSQDSDDLPAAADNTAGGNGHQKHSGLFGSLAVGRPVSDRTSRMKSRVEKTKIDVICPHCSKRIKWAWLIQYHSFQYAQLVTMCSECEQVIRIQNAPRSAKESSPLSKPPFLRKKQS